MKPCFFAAMGMVLALALSPPASASPFGADQGASPKLSGEFFTEYLELRNESPKSNAAGPALVDSGMDGLLLAEKTPQNVDGLWWSGWDRNPNAPQIDRGAASWIDRFFLQPGNGTAFKFAGLGDEAPKWVRFAPQEGWDRLTRPYVLLPDPGVTRYVGVYTPKAEGFFAPPQTGGSGWLAQLIAMVPFDRLAISESMVMMILAFGLTQFIAFTLR